MTGVLVRPARPDELPAVGELTALAYVVDGFEEPGGSYLEQLRDAARREREAELLVAVDAVDDARLLGTVTVCTAGTPLAELSRPGELEFRMLAVAPGARGRGVGELLARAVLDRAHAAGASAVVLCSQRGMAAAHRLYRRLGFVRDPERDWRPAPDVDLLAFRLDL